ncbi:short-chain dehydrogenase [Neobacillus piezotolerans]|uniref:Short-chain dehydrogenase n=1 Tax=Neobacillus piezotolerans TaxID=2259171 RepID=A0A3D8GPD4_9BACI|nr:SDR family NAD(P)-dependent oxidoreductase [Neobacillus piezotolerans]RDU35936.1 short-chain dehydrogenase [Neobacillus piezotolerans]
METFVVTGAGSGLGRETALLLAEKGWDVLLVGRTMEKLLHVKEEIEASNGSASVLALDVADSDNIPEKLAHALTGKTVHGLVNSAGIGHFGPFGKMDNAQIAELFNANALGTIFMTKAVLPYLEKKESGYVVNIISTAGLRGKANESVYAASKFAVRGFTESLQKEYEGSRIKFTAAYMGGMDTPFWEGSSHVADSSKFMPPREIARRIVEGIGEKEIIIERQK